MVDTFVVYVAGFFDGEGSIDIRWRQCKSSANNKSYERFELRVHVTQIMATPLELMAQRWGGAVSKRKNSKCSDYVVTGLSAAKFLKEIEPFLIVKKDEAAIAIEFAGTMQTKLPNTAGSKGIDKLSPAVREKRRALHLDLRQARDNKGVSPKLNRITAPEARVA